MTPLDALFWLCLLFLGAQLLTLLGNLALFPVLRPGRPQSALTVSLLVPARDEAENLLETLPGWLGQGAAEVLVLDDGSTDATPRILAEAARRHPGLRVLAGRPLPEGWSGKNWACHQLAEAARGDALVFTDADTRWEPGALAALLAFREREGADFVSVWPRQVTVGGLERVVLPVIDQILLAGLPYWGVRHLPFAALAAGNGQLMLWTRAAYTRIGGHAVFRAEVLEDVRMGQAAKGRGLRVALALGGDLVSVRMYRSAGALLEGLAKNIVPAAGGPLPLAALVALNALAHTGAWLLALMDARWLVVGAMSLSLRTLTDLKTGRSPLDAPLQALVAFPLTGIAALALARGGGYRWKGRDYRG